MKKNFFWFFLTWNLSALWVYLSYVAGMVAVTSKHSSDLTITEYVFCFFGFLVWLAGFIIEVVADCLLYTSPSPRDAHESRMPSSA